MCGIAGIISYIPAAQFQPGLKQMADALRHRGPDGEGFWNNNDSTVGFAHRRLAILDLTTAAAQPLHYLHYTIIFNGEIYNYKELKETLKYKGYSFFSSGDTEVIPAAYDCWGLDFLNHLDGMFAFALYNERTKVTILARDRFGEKPLYYTYQQGLVQPAVLKQEINAKHNNGILFASEMKAFWAAGVRKQVNETMLLNYITIGYVQNPADKSATFFKGIFSLPPAHIMQVNTSEKKVTVQRWYHGPQLHHASPNDFKNEKATTEKFNELFVQSVSRRLRSDVTLGTSLSGGLDSSSIVSAMYDWLTKSGKAGTLNKNDFAKVFTATFPGFDKDESAYAKQVTQHFKLKQYTVNPTADDLVKHWQKVMYHQEEPVQSSSVFTQFMVYALAKEQDVTVLLDGQGADEILAGYTKYGKWYLQQLIRKNPFDFYNERALLLKNDLLDGWHTGNYLAAFMPSFTAKQLSGDAQLQVRKNNYMNDDYVKQAFNKKSLQKPVIGSLESMLYYNTFVFGLEELLRYADRNSMAHSREVRLPFLSHELVEFVFSLPSNYKIRNGFTKWILRQAMDESLPKSIVWRKGKIGYEPPQKQWMREPAMRDIIHDSRKFLADNKILKPAVLNAPVAPLNAHEAGNFDWRYINAAGIMA